MMPQASAPPTADAGITPKKLLCVCLCTCLLTAGCAYWVMHAVEAPWTGETGSLVFRGNEGQASALDRGRKVLQFYFDTRQHRLSKLEVDNWISVGLWCGSLFVLAASLLGAATARWWARWIRHSDGVARPVNRGFPPRWSIAVLVLAMALGTLLRVATIWIPPYWDEQDNMARNFHGYIEYSSPEAAPVWKPAGIKDALWENSRGNNPYLYSLLSQLSQKIWRVFSGASEERFSIVAIRMPAVIFGVLAIAALWWSLNRMELMRVAPWAALMLSIHGLAIEFSVEARGHGLALCFSAFLLGLAWSALNGGSGRLWFVYGATLVCSLLSNPASLYHVVCLNLFIAAVLWWQGWKGGDRMARCGLARWGLANAAAALFYFWIVAPAMPQAALYISTKFPTGDMGLAWHTGFLIAYASGLCASAHAPRRGALLDPAMPESDMHGWKALSWLFEGFQHSVPLVLWSLVCFPLLLVAGWRYARQKPAGRRRAWLLSVSVASGPLMVLIQPHLTKASIIYFWYIIFIAPATICLASCGLTAVGDWLATHLRLTGRRDWVVAGVAGLAMLWLLGISSSLVSGKSWTVGHAQFRRKPVHRRWHREPGMIRSVSSAHGKHDIWMSYEDGYLVVLSGYQKQPAAWGAMRLRPMTSWGRLSIGSTTSPQAADLR